MGSALFDLKHDRGGMVDIEFVVQYWVLLHAREHREFVRNAGNITLLKIAAQSGLKTTLAGAVVSLARGRIRITPAPARSPKRK